MIAQRVFAVGCEELEQFAAHWGGEACANANVLENLRVVVKAEEKRTDRLACCLFVPAEASDDAVAVALMLDLEHDALVGLICEVEGLGNDPVKTGALEAFEPVRGEAAIGGCGCDVDRRLRGFQECFEFSAALAEGRGAQVVLTLAEHVKEYT